jgi:hypothetical protein
MKYSMSDEFRDTLEQLPPSQLFRDFFRFCLLLNEFQKYKKPGEGITSTDADRLFILSIIDGKIFNIKSDYEIVVSKSGPLARSKLLKVKKDSNLHDSGLITDIAQNLANLLPGNKALPYLKFADGLFFASVSSEYLRRWIGENVITPEEHRNLQLLARMYSYLDYSEIEALASVRNMKMFRRHVISDLRYWSRMFFRACKALQSFNEQESWIKIEDTLNEAWDWSKSARLKVELYETKIASTRAKIEAALSDFSKDERSLVQSILDTINANTSHDDFIKGKHWSLISNCLSGIFLNAATLCGSGVQAISQAPLPEVWSELIAVYGQAREYGLTIEDITQELNQLMGEVITVVESTNKIDCNKRLGDIFDIMAQKIALDTKMPGEIRLL